MTTYLLSVARKKTTTDIKKFAAFCRKIKAKKISSITYRIESEEPFSKLLIPIYAHFNRQFFILFRPANTKADFYENYPTIQRKDKPELSLRKYLSFVEGVLERAEDRVRNRIQRNLRSKGASSKPQ